MDDTIIEYHDYGMGAEITAPARAKQALPGLLLLGLLRLRLGNDPLKLEAFEGITIAISGHPGDRVTLGLRLHAVPLRFPLRFPCGFMRFPAVP